LGVYHHARNKAYDMKLALGIYISSLYMKAGDVSLFEDLNKAGMPGHVALHIALRADLDLETALSW